ncbi:hypothetical protein GGG16DRAFT_84947, partial [Schizophyllum commune]
MSSRPPRSHGNTAQIKRYLRQPSSFSYLHLDPYALEADHWELQSSQVLGAIADLEYLNYVLEGRMKEYRSIDGDIQECITSLWPTLLLWLDFLHPVHHAQDRKERVPLETLCRTIFYFFSTPDLVTYLRSTTPSLHNMLLLLWLRFDEYRNANCDAYQCINGLASSVRMSMWIKDKSFAENINSPEAMSNYPTAIAQNLHPHFLPAALGAVKNRPRRLLHQMLKQTRLLIDLTLARKPSYLDDVNNHCIAVAEFSNELLPLDTQAKDVVEGWVELLRSIRGIPNLRVIAITVCSVLHGMWRSSVDGRPLAWAIRRDVMLSILWLDSQAHNGQLTGSMRLITTHGDHVCVVRTLAKKEVSFVGTGLGESVEEQERIDQWVRERAALIRRLYKVRCSRGAECPNPGRLCRYRCACFSAFYCGEECQQKDWPSHQPYCLNGRERPRYRLERGTITPRDERYVVAFASEFIQDHAQTIVVAILGARKRVPPVGPAVELVINVMDVVPKAIVNARRDDLSMENEDIIPVFASISTGGSSARMELTRTTLAELQEKARPRLAEGYDAGGIEYLIHKPVTVFR